VSSRPQPEALVPHLPWHTLVVTLALSAEALAWGGTAHRFVNENAVRHLPAAMAQLSAQRQFLADHASDADRRKSYDTSEAPKHYLDLELYADYQSLPADLAQVVAAYGWPTVKERGILPWATIWAVDSMTAQLKRGSWEKACQTAADIGHYVADAYQPLHCTANYDGAQTGNDGIHYRYESAMITKYAASLAVGQDSAVMIADPYRSALAYIVRSNGYVDTILSADDRAKAVSGWTGSGTPPDSYYAVLWEQTQATTLSLLQEATVTLASLWYTAWMNAGVTVADGEQRPGRQGLTLEQNFPNPFNPVTEIRWSMPARGHVVISLHDLLGREVAVLADHVYEAGSHALSFDGTQLSSGVYVYRLRAGAASSARRMVLLR